MCDRLRAGDATVGVVTGVGWYLTKHSAGVYSTTPPSTPYAAVDGAAVQARVDADPRPSFVEAPNGRGTIETYTVLHDRDGSPIRGIVVGRLADGPRFIANTPNDRALFDAFTSEEGVGRGGRVTNQGDANVFAPD